MALVDKVRRKLRVTYRDDEIDERIDEIMEQADADLRSMLAITERSFTFENGGTEQALFLAYCFYEWNDALDDFEVNYTEKIAKCRDRWLAVEYAQKATSA
jgi:hypothetical protein|nr:MAG TPA_asm: hypothetical protein [Caudoviricetes sp.]